MDAPLRFLWAEGSCLVEWVEVYEWVERFKANSTTVTDENRPGRPSNSRTAEHIQEVNNLIKDNPLVDFPLIHGALSLLFLNPAVDFSRL